MGYERFRILNMSKNSFLLVQRRLRTQSDFRKVFQGGRRYSGKSMVLVVRNRGSEVKVGFRATRSVGNAVRRNRAKRIMRELFRSNRERFATGCEIVCIARDNILYNSYAINELEFVSLLRKARCIVSSAG